MMRIRPQLKITRELINAQIPLLLLWPVAVEAVCLKKGIERICGCGVSSSRQGKAGAEDQTGKRRVTEGGHGMVEGW
jgi:hypothetical protein